MVSQIPSKYRLSLFIVAAAAFLVAVYGAQEAIKTNTNNVLDWLPAAFRRNATLSRVCPSFRS